MATISAQPMLQLSLSQPGTSFQASHSLLKIIPITHDEEVSTQNLIGEGEGGLDNEDLVKGVDSDKLLQ